MKIIIAYIKPHRLSEVSLALHSIDGLTGLSFSDVQGFGRGRAKDAPDAVLHDTLSYLPRMRLEIACPDTVVEQVITTIEQHAKTGLRGDGKIYVFDLSEAIRISTGERGSAAI